MDDMWDEEAADEGEGPGVAPEPELMDGQCLSLAQLREAVEIAIERLPADVEPESVPVKVLGRVEDGQGETFHLQDIVFGVKTAEGVEQWDACLVTDGSGYDEAIEEL